MIAAGAAIALFFLPGRASTTYLFFGALVAGGAAMFYLLHRTRTPATFHDGVGVAIGWYIPALAVSCAVPYFGPFSPAPIVLVLGVFFTGLGSSVRVAAALYATCAIAQAVTGGLVIAGYADPGFVHAGDLPTSVQILCQALVQIVLAGTFIVARASRSSALAALGELERAVRAVAQREALLEEAREELRNALGNGRGRFTDQTIGNYRLADLIGRGAMGEVYEAVDPRTNTPVAVKMLSQASLGNAHHVQRFLRELQTATAIDSPNVVHVLEIGEHPIAASRDGAPARARSRRGPARQAHVARRQARRSAAPSRRRHHGGGRGRHHPSRSQAADSVPRGRHVEGARLRRVAWSPTWAATR